MAKKKIRLAGPRVGYKECRECGKKFLLATILIDGLCKKCASE